MMNEVIEVKISTDFIKLDSFLKLASAVSTGGHAKIVITGGEVKVNGQICIMRGKKLYKDDTVEFEGQKYLVTV